MNEDIKKIYEKVVVTYRRNRNVLGIMAFGSAVRGTFDRYSDLDIYILVKGKSASSRVNFVKGNVRVDIIFNTAKELKDYLKKDKGSLRRVTSHMLAHGKIIFERGTTLKEAKRVAEQNLRSRTAYCREAVLMHKYSIDDFWGEVRRDAARGDYIAFGLDSQLLANNILELFLESHGAFLPQPNETEKCVERLDPKFARLLRDFYAANGLKKRTAALGKLVTAAYKRTGGPLPRRWSL